jgi:hypothetical protein
MNSQQSRSPWCSLPGKSLRSGVISQTATRLCYCTPGKESRHYIFINCVREFIKGFTKEAAHEQSKKMLVSNDQHDFVPIAHRDIHHLSEHPVLSFRCRL